MNCIFCNKPLTSNQIYEVLRGKTKGFCSKSCAMNHIYYKSPAFMPDYRNKYILFEKKCKVCKISYKTTSKSQMYCSSKCAGVLSSIRMIENNPMKNIDTRKKVSNTLKEIHHKPIIQGGNGRGATLEQLLLYNELIKIDGSFEMEVIVKTGGLRCEYNAPNHYKLDIASKIHNLSIEIDGRSHNSLKIKECDERKTKLLNLKGWRVLRLSNCQIRNELTNCVQTVLSMI